MEIFLQCPPNLFYFYYLFTNSLTLDSRLLNFNEFFVMLCTLYIMSSVFSAQFSELRYLQGICQPYKYKYNFFSCARQKKEVNESEIEQFL